MKSKATCKCGYVFIMFEHIMANFEFQTPEGKKCIECPKCHKKYFVKEVYA